MFLRYIKAQVMVLLCGGLVGPIFLAVYFAIGQEPILKWMFYVGLLITALDILIALALACVGGVLSLINAYLQYQNSGNVAYGKIALAFGVPIMFYAIGRSASKSKQA